MGCRGHCDITHWLWAPHFEGLTLTFWPASCFKKVFVVRSYLYVDERGKFIMYQLILV